MLSCKQVAKALLKENYAEMNPARRAAMFAHIFLCPMCGPYHKKVVKLQKGVRVYLEHEEDETLKVPPMSADARMRIRRAVNQSTGSDASSPE